MITDWGYLDPDTKEFVHMPLPKADELPPTEKQLSTIAQLRRQGATKFLGTTKKEAQVYIGRWIAHFNARRSK